MSFVTGIFSPVLLLNQGWSPTLRLQGSHRSTFHIIIIIIIITTTTTTTTTAITMTINGLEHGLVGFKTQ